MAEDYEDELEDDRKESQGNICVKSIVLLSLSVMLVVILSVLFGYLVESLYWSYPYVPVISPAHFASTVFTFVIGADFGYIVRKVSMRNSGD